MKQEKQKELAGTERTCGATSSVGVNQHSTDSFTSSHLLSIWPVELTYLFKANEGGPLHLVMQT